MSPDREAPLKLGLIWAQSRNGVIGASGSIPWHLPEDLAHFRLTTEGSPVIMGRKTWQSLPERSRPLPSRENIVLSGRLGFEAPGAHVARNLDEALEIAAQMSGSERAWVIGGARVYVEAIERADLLVVTQVDVEVEGDVFAPAITRWKREATPSRWSATGLRYRFITYSPARSSPRPRRRGLARAAHLAEQEHLPR